MNELDRTLIDVLEAGGHVIINSGETLTEFRSRCIAKAIQLIQDMVRLEIIA